MSASLTAQAHKLGEISTRLLYDDVTWVNRRKDVVKLLDDAWVHRKMTVDCRIPDHALFGRSGSKDDVVDLCCIPLGLLAKSPPSLMDFDLKDETGKSLPLTTRSQNELASYAALVYAAQHAGEREVPLHLTDGIRIELLSLATADGDAAEAWTKRLLDEGADIPIAQMTPDDLVIAEETLNTWAQELAGSPVPPGPAHPDLRLDGDADVRALLRGCVRFRWLAETLSKSAILLTQLPLSPTRRKIVKLSYAHNVFKASPGLYSLLGWRGYPFTVENPYVGSNSYHFEFQAPEGLDVVESALIDMAALDDDQQSEGTPLSLSYESEPRRGRRVHMYLPNATGTDEVIAYINVRVEREGFISGASLASFAVLASILVFAGVAPWLVHSGSSGPSLLLAFPGILVAVANRTEAHPMIVRMLQAARRLLLLSGVLAFAAAIAFAMNKTGSDAKASTALRVVLLGLAVCAAFPAMSLLISRRLPRPREEHGPLEKLVDSQEHRLQALATGLAKVLARRRL
jgi:hypothetical protein